MGASPIPTRKIRVEKNVGVERAVTRWYVLHQMLSEEIERLEASIALPSDEQEDATASNERAAMQKQLGEAQVRLRLLGPCPRPMMG
jgi:hypothetical protein